jgi:hypothetical protein
MCSHTKGKDRIMRYSGGRQARRNSARIVTGALVAGGALLVSSPGAQAHPTSVTFTTPGAASWTVPRGISSVSVLVSGAQGGGVDSGLADYGRGGLGADVSALLTVTPGEELSLTVGGTSGDQTGGLGGGGAGGSARYGGAGGGGASTVLVNGTSWVVAGGGGGAAAYGISGGGSGHQGGASGRTQDGGAGGAGIAGVQPAAGAGGTGGRTNTVDFATCTSTALNGPGGSSGAKAAGGKGGARDETVSTAGGGGGGGGYVGGGGGGAGAYCLTQGADSFGYGGAGGGGSSYVLSAVAVDQKVSEGAHPGNGSITITYSYADTTAPTSEPVVTPAPVRAGWNGSEVTVQWNWSDQDSGLDPADCEQSTASEDAEGMVVLDSTCRDLAGNVSTDSVTVKIDRTAPSITVQKPVSRIYHRGRSVVARYRCKDAGAGVASCKGTVANGKPIATRKLGKHSFSVKAVDRLGHTRTVRLIYRVVR